jgi:hypothetical protein
VCAQRRVTPFEVSGLRAVGTPPLPRLPWPLQPAAGKIERNAMTAPHGIDLPGAPVLHFSSRQDVLIWLPRALTSQRVGRRGTCV